MAKNNVKEHKTYEKPNFYVAIISVVIAAIVLLFGDNIIGTRIIKSDGLEIATTSDLPTSSGSAETYQETNNHEEENDKRSGEKTIEKANQVEPKSMTSASDAVTQSVESSAHSVNDTSNATSQDSGADSSELPSNYDENSADASPIEIPMVSWQIVNIPRGDASQSLYGGLRNYNGMVLKRGESFQICIESMPINATDAIFSYDLESNGEGISYSGVSISESGCLMISNTATGNFWVKVSCINGSYYTFHVELDYIDRDLVNPSLSFEQIEDGLVEVHISCNVPNRYALSEWAIIYQSDGDELIINIYKLSADGQCFVRKSEFFNTNGKTWKIYGYVAIGGIQYYTNEVTIS